MGLIGILVTPVQWQTGFAGVRVGEASHLGLVPNSDNGASTLPRVSLDPDLVDTSAPVSVPPAPWPVPCCPAPSPVSAPSTSGALASHPLTHFPLPPTPTWQAPVLLLRKS